MSSVRLKHSFKAKRYWCKDSPVVSLGWAIFGEVTSEVGTSVVAPSVVMTLAAPVVTKLGVAVVTSVADSVVSVVSSASVVTSVVCAVVADKIILNHTWKHLYCSTWKLHCRETRKHDQSSSIRIYLSVLIPKVLPR